MAAASNVDVCSLTCDCATCRLRDAAGDFNDYFWPVPFLVRGQRKVCLEVCDPGRSAAEPPNHPGRNIGEDVGMVARLFVVGIVLFACVSDAAAEKLTLAEVQAIAKEAYVYGFPLVDNYRVMYSYAINENDPEFKAPMNQIRNVPRVYTPDDRAIQTPNSDTPYSMLVLDLRSEPIVITLPKVEKGRYYSVQLVDLYTFNFDYLGSRTTGNDGGSFLVAGPDWQGEKPAGIERVIRSETQLALVIFRTQLFKPTDLQNVAAIQAGYKAEALSVFLGEASPPHAPAIDFLEPLSAAEERTSLDFFNELAFLLQFCPTHPSEVELRERFAKIGIVPGQPFGTAFMSAGEKSALAAGMADGQAEIDQRLKGLVSSSDLFGTRESMGDDYLNRALAAQAGIYGNSKAEAFYIPFMVDTGGHLLDGSQGEYTLTFAAGELPPVRAFWSLTMYSLPDQLLVENSINRYLINSPMLPDMVTGDDGSLTIYIKKDSPGDGKNPNWLPAPDGPFSMVLRLYWPEQAVLKNAWRAPGVERAE
jgi:hypothetical protein